MDYYQDMEIKRMRERIGNLKAAMRHAIRVVRGPQMDNGDTVSAREVLESALKEDDKL
jgi:hypothetical protein